MNIDLQQRLFQHIRTVLPSHLALVDEIADALEISNDSAYRRIRGDTTISLEEVQKIAARYKISLDQFLHLQSNSFVFSGDLADAKSFDYKKWIESTLANFQFMNSFRQKHLYFLSKDIPFFAHFQVPELGAFKHFFWRKSILHYDEMRGVKFSVSDTDAVYSEIGNRIVDVYNHIPSTEIWNLESINSTIRQIEFYKEAKIFRSMDEAHLLYDKLGELVNHFEAQAELGVKFRIGQPQEKGTAGYTMFVNEVVLGDNTFHAMLDGRGITFLNHSVLNFISTTDDAFTSYMQGTFDNLIKKSTQISATGEKERSRFFNRLRDKIRLSARM